LPRRKKPATAAAPPLDEEESSARPFWSGTITFGLVSIPVNLYPASRSTRTSLRMLSPDGVPLRRRYFSAKSDKELEDEDMVRGFETAKDKYVVVTDEELERLAPEKSRDIDLRLFVKEEDIPPIYFEHAYFLAPAGGSVKAYQLLAEVMERKQRAGIATFVMREKEYLVGIFAQKGILHAETLRFADEVRSPKEIGLPHPGRVSKSSVQKFKRAIQKKAANEISREELRDEYAEKLLKLVERKEQHHKDVVHAEKEEREPAKVVDLMEVLKKSMEGKKAG
jgi:DNA end-binding protein Ku